MVFTPMVRNLGNPKKSHIRTEWTEKIPKFNTSCLYLQAGTCERRCDCLAPEFTCQSRLVFLGSLLNYHFVG